MSSAHKPLPTRPGLYLDGWHARGWSRYSVWKTVKELHRGEQPRWKMIPVVHRGRYLMKVTEEDKHPDRGDFLVARVE